MDKKVLLVVGMQNDFVAGTLGSTQAQVIVKGVVKKVKEYYDAELPIFFTKDTHFAEEYHHTQEGRKLPIAHCLFGTDGHEIIEELKEYAEDSIIICKDTFGELSIPSCIEGYCDIPFPNKLAEVEIIGLCTDVCVIANAIILKTAFPEAKVAVNANLCAGVTNDGHDLALEAMKGCQVDIIGE